MSQLQQAAETITKGCDRLRESVLARDHVPTVLALIEQHRSEALRSVGVGTKPGRPADIYKQPQELWP
jgi:hypothetical protein